MDKIYKSIVGWFMESDTSVVSVPVQVPKDIILADYETSNEYKIPYLTEIGYKIDMGKVIGYTTLTNSMLHEITGKVDFLKASYIVGKDIDGLKINIPRWFRHDGVAGNLIGRFPGIQGYKILSDLKDVQINQSTVSNKNYAVSRNYIIITSTGDMSGGMGYTN